MDTHSYRNTTCMCVVIHFHIFSSSPNPRKHAFPPLADCCFPSAHIFQDGDGGRALPALLVPPHMLHVFPDVLVSLLDAVRRCGLGVSLGDPSALWVEPSRASPSLCQPETDSAPLSLRQTQSGSRQRELPTPTRLSP